MSGSRIATSPTQVGADEVQAGVPLGLRLGDGAADERQRGQADRDVDQEARAPVEIGGVELDEHAADELAADRGDAEGQRVGHERLHPVRAGVGHAEDRQDLRHHQRRRGALRHARGDEQAGGGSDAARGRGQDEQREADREHPPAAELVAEPPAGDEPGGEGQAVAGDDPLDRVGAGVEVALHRGHRDVDDEEVEDDHERAGEDHRQRGPLPQAGRPGAVEGVDGCGVGGHGNDGPTATEACRFPLR
jgi:hypothetical protein